jgi:cell division protein ZapA (FtsZ GTPase activity inhibitor)
MILFQIQVYHCLSCFIVILTQLLVNHCLYKVKTYHYDKLSKLERAKRKEQKESKRQQEISNIELSKIVNQMFHSQTFR